MHTGGKPFGWLRLPALKANHAYSSSVYRWLLLSNLVLRFTWAHRLLGDLEAHNEVLMVVALLEVVRRWQWVYVRVETELRKLGLLAGPVDQQQLIKHASTDDGSTAVSARHSMFPGLVKLGKGASEASRSKGDHSRPSHDEEI
jgi:hypothetical protein